MLINLLIALRYTLIQAIAWLVWYKLFNKQLDYKKIQPAYPSQNDYVREIVYSFITVFIFAFVPAVVLLTPFRHYTQFYTDIHQYGMVYFWLVFPIAIVIHDAYFYWIHRLMHHQFFFKTMHLVHHKSINPSPWAALSFHPLEAFLETGILVLLLLIMPVTKWHLIFVFMIMMVFNVYGHIGWEVYPKGFAKSWWGKWINTAVSHNQHHEFSKGNYGFYFLWWDKWMGTLRHDYEDKYEEVTSKQRVVEGVVYEAQPELVEENVV